MSNTALTYLHAVVPRSDVEARDLEQVIELAASDAAWSRAELVHLTASALIVHPPSRQVLLRWHERQQGWLQVGGHADPGETDPLQIAMREGAEETGLHDLRPWPDARMQHVVVVPVPASPKEPAHHHADLRFVLATDHPEHARPENPTAPLRWLSVAEAVELVGEDNVRELIEVVASLFD
jgi:8-oxo-dGTP pyrophosphatase MutT (NUDIX family)